MAHKLQQAFFRHIRKQLPKERNLAVEVSGIINLSPSAAYKRIEGKVTLTLGEVALLAKHYHVSVDEILHNGKIVTCTFSGFTAPASCLDYLKAMERELTRILQSPDPKLWFVTNELPDFYYFYFEELALFRIYTWERMVWNSPEWQTLPFSFDLPFRNEVCALTKRIVHLYQNIPAVEIWNEHVLDSFLHQLVYAFESRLLQNPEDGLILLRKLQKLVRHVDDMAFAGNRSFPGGKPADGTASFQLFLNQTMQNNLLMLVKTGGNETIYTSLFTPHFLKSSDSSLATHTAALFEKLWERAEPLGHTGEKYRRSFFEKLFSHIRGLEKKMNAGIEQAPPPHLRSQG